MEYLARFGRTRTDIEYLNQTGEHMPFDITLEVGGDSFVATTSHRTRPDTRRAFQVGPDGVVMPLE